MRWRDIEKEPPPRDEFLWLAWEVDWPEPAWEYAVDMHHNTRGSWQHGRATHWAPIEPPGKPTVEDNLLAALRDAVIYGPPMREDVAQKVRVALNRAETV